jgi:hypothetical protein
LVCNHSELLLGATQALLLGEWESYINWSYCERCPRKCRKNTS